MSLKTDYKNDMFAGSRRYRLTDNQDGTWSIEDVTEYAVTGDVFNGDDINKTNQAINMHETKMGDLQRSIDDQAKIQRVYLSASAWNLSRPAPYVQRVDVLGMQSTDAPVPGIIYPPEMTRENKQIIDKCFDMITEMETFDGYLQVTCKFDHPTTDLIIELKGR